MFRDSKEELNRLEAELLEDNTPEETLLDEEQLDALLEDDRSIGSAESASLYRNYSTGYRAYNADKTDIDPETLSQELLTPGRDKVVTGLTALAIFLLLAILGILGWVLLTVWGVL